MTVLGRWAQIAGGIEVTDLAYGQDFRLPQYRREVFHRFYEYHLRYRSHPGAVYYLLPGLARHFGWDLEQRLWFAFINGNTQNPVTSLTIFTAFPTPRNLGHLPAWWKANSASLAFDTDRRYFRTKFPEAAARYAGLVEQEGSQEALFGRVYSGARTNEARFDALWNWGFTRTGLLYFGRLSMFSYSEYLAISGLPVACSNLFLHDLSGSKSHRNGLCKVLGRDDLEWRDGFFDGSYTTECLHWLEHEAAALLSEARQRAAGKPWEGDVGYFTLESALCTYKSWHRPNRRYPNVYNDMLYLRIKSAEAAADTPLPLFWSLRRAVLPPHLLLEDNPADCGLAPTKQNHYLHTGQPVMMHREWPCFRNDYNDAITAAQGQP